MCLFCRILRGEEEGYIVYRDDFFTAFLDKFPVSPGHTLIATNTHFDNILEVDDETLERVGKVVKFLGRAIKNALRADGVRILTNVGRSSGQVIFHTHIHIIPSWEDDQEVFPNFKPRAEQPKEYYMKLQRIIIEGIEKELKGNS